MEAFEVWIGFDMVFDYYRLLSADELAIEDIGLLRPEQYELLCQQWKTSEDQSPRLWSSVLYRSFHGKHSNNFKIDLNSGVIRPLGYQVIKEK